MNETSYPPIADYALLSDCHSAALVSRTGSIDWACLGRFDNSSVFGRLLDWDRAGSFRIGVDDLESSERRYLGDSLVLETVLRTPTGAVRIVDAFSMHSGGAQHPHNQLLRIVEAVEGTVELGVVIEPRFDYGQLRPWLRHHDETGAWSATGGPTALVLTVECELELDREDSRLTGRIVMEPGRRLRFAVDLQAPEHLDATPCPAEEIDSRLDATVQWWQRWSADTRAEGPYADAIRRSVVVLQGLICAPTGAMVAAPTTSLPEEIGGERNWDYRYTWIRDSTLVLAALERTGHPAAARGFRDFLLRTAAGNAADLHIMYGLDGTRYLPERELTLEGYRGSGPVRVGNGAYDQTQHDMYGQILDAAHRWQEGHEPVDEDEWRFLHALVERALEVWETPDQGIWEVRSEPRHFVHSKVLLWVAVDRGIRFAEERGNASSDLERWRAARDAIRQAIETKGVDPEGGYFTQAFGTSEVDAALLELPMVGFVPADDERMMRTVDVILRDLSAGQKGFLHRYRTEAVDDGLDGDEGVFLMCSFWLVDVMAMQGRVAEAAELFERLLATANDVGLMSEQYDPDIDEMLGNYPQAFTHMALINAAAALDRATPDVPSDDDGGADG